MRNLTVILLLFFQVCMALETKPSVAVSDLVARGMTKDEADIITDRLRQEILATGAFRVMEREMMAEVMKEQTFQQTATCGTSECQVQMGRLLGVDRMIVGSVGKLGEMYSISIRMLNVETGEVVVSLSEDHDGAIEGLVKGPLRSLAFKLAAGVGQVPGAHPVQTNQGSAQPALQTSSNANNLANLQRGFPGLGLVWNVRKSKTETVSIDISNSVLAGLSLRPSSSEPVLWYNLGNQYSYDYISLNEYMPLGQAERKAVLFGRLLHFGGYYVSEMINIDTSLVRKAVQMDVQSEIDVATFARARASRKTSGFLWGTVGILTGFYTAYAGLLQTKCDTYGYCEPDPNMQLASAGGLIMLASSAYLIYKLAVPSSEEEEAAQRVKIAVEKLNQ